MRLAALPAKVAGIAVPDTSVAKEAIDLARTVSSQMLFNHAMRSFFFGKLITAAQQLRTDDEVVFLSTTLHDLGLTDYAAGPRRFEIESADAARNFLVGKSYDEHRGWLVWDTIALHTWADINLYKQPEAMVAQLGITADVVGMGLDAVEPAQIDEVVRAFPRANFNNDFFQLLLREAQTKPQTHVVHPVHMVGHHCCGGVPIPDAQAMIAESPFDE